MFKRIGSLGLIVFLLLAVLPAHAVDGGGTLHPPGGSWNEFSCADGTIDVTFSFTADASDGGEDWVGVVVFDGGGVPLDVMAAAYAPGPVDRPTVYQMSFSAMNAITARPVHVQLYDTGNLSGMDRATRYDAVRGGRLLDEFIYDPARYAAVCFNLPYRPSDDPNQPPDAFSYLPEPAFDTAGVNVLISMLQAWIPDYPVPKVSYVVWRLTGVNQGYAAFNVTEDTLYGLPASPESPLVVGSSSDQYIKLLKMPSGEFHLEVGPDGQGLVQVVVYDRIPPTQPPTRADYTIGSPDVPQPPADPNNPQPPAGDNPAPTAPVNNPTPPTPTINTAGADVLITPNTTGVDAETGLPVQSYAVWGIANNQGYLAFSVTLDALSELPEHPEPPILVASDANQHVRLYKLPSGEFSLQIGPDEEGKVQVVIYDTLPPTTPPHREDWNVNEIE